MAEKKKFYLTKEGLERIKKEYKDLKVLRLNKIKGTRPKILHSQDVNPEYLSFQEDLSRLEFRIAELDNILENVKIIKTPPKGKQGIVNLGAIVTLEEQDGKINEFMIVGTLEANPSEGKISSQSPVGKALLGRKTGDEIIITSPIKIIYRIKEIKYYPMSQPLS
ncbi:GreA/GreB family elongation factor [Patescibacteria group bacterium]|nr:GreA/GreB family elongation factor [Patescibacteria group bacterium]